MSWTSKRDMVKCTGQMDQSIEAFGTMEFNRALVL